MKRTCTFILAITLLGFFCTSPSTARAQEKPKAAAAKETPGKPKPATTPFKGKIDAADNTAKTITVGTRTFHVTSTTKLTKAGKPATFADATVGEEVGGAYKTGADGKLELTSLRIGPKPAKETAPSEKKPSQAK